MKTFSKSEVDRKTFIVATKSAYADKHATAVRAIARRTRRNPLVLQRFARLSSTVAELQEARRELLGAHAKCG